MSVELSKTKEQQHHYFCSSIASWATDDDMYQAIRKIHREDGRICNGCNVYKVPVPASALYEIELFAPQVEGTEWITFVNYRQPRGKKA